MQENTDKSEIAKNEEEVLKFWQENKIFEKSLEKDSPEGEFVFYEGPPTANGRPGIHHVEARAFKDIIPRYKTMRGYHVRRKAGWDTHGLPVELEVEKQLGLTSKKEIEEYGIAKFNDKCKESVWTYVDEWKNFTERVAFWEDMSDPYVTYDPNFMESIWHLIKKVDDQKLLYKDYKVLPWCPRCETALSSHELAQGYEDTKDISVYIKFKVVDPAKHDLPEDTRLLAWTTTPWTLPGNVALAVKGDIRYSLVEFEGQNLIMGEALVGKVLGEDAKVVKELTGKDMLGMEYEPLYPYLRDNLPESEKEKLDTAFKVHEADFVTTEDGTGIVHTAVMYGQDDFILGNEIGLPKFHMVNQNGLFVPEADFLAGKFVKDEATDVEIIKDLHAKDLLLKKEKIEHSYPFCWRCKTALIYYARDSWYIRMSELRDELVKENEGIHWEPEYIKEGRFGEWLKDIKDWAISRERYWGTPLPVWECNKCDHLEVLGSIEDVKAKMPSSGNSYTLMRHAESPSNVGQYIDASPTANEGLTEKGEEQAREAAKKLKGENFDVIIHSDFKRTTETAKIVAEELGVEIIKDKRIRETDAGDFEGGKWSDWHAQFENEADEYSCKPCSGETRSEVDARVSEFLFELEEKYKDKKILIVSHGMPIVQMHMIVKGWHSINQKVQNDKSEFFYNNAEFRTLDFKPYPHNNNYELDLHKPYIDEVVYSCDKCDGGEMKRSLEVLDVWFDSGAMPFAQDHYPFENKDLIDGPGYPADFISEAIDQTRGWFYTLHAIGVLMGKGKAFKNVICLGLILDAEGKKMSKSVGNVVNPWEMIDKYGADALRFWMYSVNQPGDSKNFDEKTVDEITKKVFNLLRNSVKFYELQEKGNEVDATKSKNILDRWILSLLNQLIENTKNNLDNYKVLEPAREIREFIGEFSQWYVRRSRDRFKEDGEDKDFAMATMRYVMLELSKVMAPFTPFVAEEIYQKMKGEDAKESVHLEDWPEGGDFSNDVLVGMHKTRALVSQALERRADGGMKVRQPLAKLTITEKLDEEYLELIKDEVNVKEVVVGEEFVLDTELTDELKAEGDFRDLVREVQVLRKKEGLVPSDVITVTVPEDKKDLIEKFEDEFKKTVSAKEVNFGNGLEISK